MSKPRLSISVDLEPQGQIAGELSRESLDLTARTLVDLLSGEQRAVTWVSGDPAASRATGWAVAADCGHEAALLIAGDWSGHESGRSRFAAEFLRRKRAAEQAGIRLTTLVAPDGAPREHFELLVRQGISAIRSDRAVETKDVRNRGTAGGVTSLRYGLWQFTSAMRWAGGGWLADQLAARRICRAIDRAIATGMAIHLVIDAPRLAMRPRGQFNGLTRILRHIERRERECLQVATIGEMVARLSTQRTVRSAQSVLRAA
jgi:hypothetical protein